MRKRSVLLTSGAVFDRTYFFCAFILLSFPRLSLGAAPLKVW